MTSPHTSCRRSSIFFSGFAAAVIFWLSAALDLALDFGGGSLSKGFPRMVDYLPIYGIFLCFPAIIIGFVAIALSKLLTVRATYALAACGSMALVIHGAITSRPGAQLERLSNRTDLSHFDYLEFQKYPTFNDGTSYAWQIRCDSEQAQLLVTKLELQQIPEIEKTAIGEYSFWQPDSRISVFKTVFKQAIPDEIHYSDDRSFVGGFSEKEELFRLARFPEAAWLTESRSSAKIPIR